MTELSLYTFIESIANAISAVQGRFSVLEGYGNDLNADNNDDVLVGNVINQTAWAKKYPCAVLMPPVEISRNKAKNTTRYQLRMYFLTTTYSTGNGLTKNVNIQTNTSKTAIKEDWSEMRTAAQDFMATMLNQFYTDITILEFIRPVKSSPEQYDRVSNMGNDKLSGVKLTFELDVVMNCTGSGNVPSWTPPTTCEVCNPLAGSPLQVWTISADGLSVGFQDAQGGSGGGGNLRLVIPITTDTAAASAANTDYVYVVNSSSTVRITLPTAVGHTRSYKVKKIGTGLVIISFTGAENGDGAIAIQLPIQFQAIEFIPNGYGNYGVF